MAARSRQHIESLAEEGGACGDVVKIRELRNSAFWFWGTFHVVRQQKFSLY